MRSAGTASLAGQLLAYAAARSAPESAGRSYPWRLEEIDDRQFRWAIDAGLAPLLHFGTGGSAHAVPAAWRDALLGADLTARVRYADLRDTAKEVIDVCSAVGTRATLLKGISISEQFYPAPHLRPMGDIDVLVPAQAREAVESAILARGYARLASHIDSEGQHHGAPLYHQERRVWVEIHTALFPRSDRVQRDNIFSASHIAAQSVPSTFHGRRVDRLSDELQLAYIAYSWMRDLHQRKIHPSFAISLFDAVYLLKDSSRTLDWEDLLGGLDNDMAMASLYVLLAYLARRRVAQVDQAILSRLAAGQRLAGAPQLLAIRMMLDHYLLGGRYWNLPFAPPAPERYTVRYQWEKRVMRRLRAWR